MSEGQESNGRFRELGWVINHSTTAETRPRITWKEMAESHCYKKTKQIHPLNYNKIKSGRNA
jgi:hypothetical protein